jgi:hypothetical protein
MRAAAAQQGTRTMALKAPGILTFLISVILVVAVLMIKLFGANVPWLSGHEFYGLLIAQLVLVSGCLVRSL